MTVVIADYTFTRAGRWRRTEIAAPVAARDGDGRCGEDRHHGLHREGSPAQEMIVGHAALISHLASLHNAPSLVRR
jgi:hypothetical protein